MPGSGFSRVGNGLVGVFGWRRTQERRDGGDCARLGAVGRWVCLQEKLESPNSSGGFPSRRVRRAAGVRLGGLSAPWPSSGGRACSCPGRLEGPSARDVGLRASLPWLDFVRSRGPASCSAGTPAAAAGEVARREPGGAGAGGRGPCGTEWWSSQREGSAAEKPGRVSASPLWGWRAAPALGCEACGVASDPSFVQYLLLWGAPGAGRARGGGCWG